MAEIYKGPEGAPLVIRKFVKIRRKQTDEPNAKYMELAGSIFQKDAEPDLDGDTYSDEIVVDAMDPLPFMFMHQRSLPNIGRVDEVDAESEEVTVGGVLFRRTNSGNDVAENIEEGMYDAFSMGFIPNEYKIIRDDDLPWGLGYEYLKITLVEVSVVDEPAVPTARITDYKSKSNVRPWLYKHYEEQVKIRRLMQVTAELRELRKAA